MTELLIKWATKMEFINTLNYDRVDDWEFESKQSQPYAAYLYKTPFVSVYEIVKTLPQIDINSKYKITFETINNGGVFDGEVQVVLGEYSTPFVLQTGINEYITDRPIGNSLFKIRGNGKIGIKNVSIEKITQDKIDLIEDEKILLNLSVSDVKDFGNKKGSYSKTFKVPSTNNNDKLFGYMFDIQSDSTFNVNKKVKAVVTNDYFSLIEGFIQLVTINNLDGRVYYEVIFFDNTIDLFEKMVDNMLYDLDLSELDHIASSTNVRDTWSFPNSGKDYVYPLVNYGYGMGSWYGGKGYDKTGVGLAVADMLPGVGVKYLFNKIFNEYGYTVKDNDFTNGDKFKRLIMPFTNKLEKLNSKLNPPEKVRCKAASDAYTYVDGAAMDLAIMLTTDKFVVDVSYNRSNINVGRINVINKDYYNEIVGADIVVDDDGTPVVDENFNNRDANIRYFKCKRAGFYKVECDFRITNIYRGQNSGVIKPRICHLKAGTYTWLTENPGYGSFKVSEPETHLNTTPVFIDANGNYTMSKNYFKMEVGDIILIKFYPTKTDCNCDAQIRELSIRMWDFSRDTEVRGIDIVADDISQKDFIKSLMFMYNLYIEHDDENPKLLNILPREDYLSEGDTKDWSYKIDLQQEHIFQTTAELQNKKINFKYTDEDTYLHQEYLKTRAVEEIAYGNKEIEFDNEFVKDKKEIEISFASSPISRVWGINGEGGNTPQFYYSHNLEEDYPANPVKYTFQTDWKPRILIYDKDDIGNNNGINTKFRFEGVSEDDKKYPYAGHFYKPFQIWSTEAYDINFDTYKPYIYAGNLSKRSLFNLYWRKYVEEINSKDGRLLTAYFSLNLEDIAKLKFNDKIFINGSYYTINKVVDFDTSGENLTKVELFKTNPVNITFEEIEDEEDYPNNWFDGEISENPHIIAGINNNISDKLPSNPSIVAGSNNSINQDSVSNLILGKDNHITEGRKNFVVGDNNTISGEGNFIFNVHNSDIKSTGNTIIGVDNVIIDNDITDVILIGSNSTTPDESGQVIIGNTIIDSGDVRTAGGLLRRGGIDTVQNPNGISNIQLIKGGENCVDNIGKRRGNDLISGGVDKV